MPRLRLSLCRWQLSRTNNRFCVVGTGALSYSSTLYSPTSLLGVGGLLLLSPPTNCFVRDCSSSNNDNKEADSSGDLEPIFAGEFWRRFEGRDTNNSSSGKKYLNILHLNAAHSYESLVSTATRQLTEQLQIPFRLKAVDLFRELDHYDSGYAISKLRMLQGHGTAEDEAKFAPVLAMAEEINLVDVLLISTPMWNYSVPYHLKHYIDIVIQPGINFKEKRGEAPKAVRPGRPLLLITSAGGAASPGRDYLGPYLKLIFSLVGFDRVFQVNMVGASRATRQEILDGKKYEIDEMAQFVEQYAHELEGTKT